MSDNNSNISVEIQANQVRFIIGRGGATINAIRSVSGANLWVETDNHNHIREPGQEERPAILNIRYTEQSQRDTCAAMLRHILGNQPMLTWDMSIPSRAVGAVIGTRGATRQGIEQRTGVRIWINQPDQTSGDELSIVSIRYRVEQQRIIAERCIQAICDGLGHEQCIPIPNDAMCHVIGKGGRKIAEIERESGARLRVNDPAEESDVASVTIHYTAEEQLIIAEQMVRTARNNNIQNFAHPEKNVTLIIAGSLLEPSGLRIATRDDNGDSVISFTSVQSSTSNGQYYKIRVPVEQAHQEDQISPSHGTGEDISLCEENKIIVEQNTAVHKHLEQAIATFFAQYAQLDMEHDAQWKVKVSLGNLLFYELNDAMVNENRSTSIQRFESATVGKDEDMKIKFENQVSSDSADAIRHFLEQNGFIRVENVDEEEIVGLSLLDLNRAEDDRRIYVDTQVQRDTSTLLPNCVNAKECKPLFISYQYATFTDIEGCSQTGLPHVPSRDLRLRLQTHKREPVDEHIIQFITSLADQGTWDDERLTFGSINETESILLDSCFVRRTESYSDEHHIVSLAIVHDQFGRNEYTEVSISSKMLDIREHDVKEIQGYIEKMLRFTENMLVQCL